MKFLDILTVVGLFLYGGSMLYLVRVIDGVAKKEHPFPLPIKKIIIPILLMSIASLLVVSILFSQLHNSIQIMEGIIICFSGNFIFTSIFSLYLYFIGKYGRYAKRK